MYKFMRTIVIFDLPTDSKRARRNATRFRNDLLKDGFSMLQYSIYDRLCVDKDSAEMHIERVRRIAPDEGSVRAFMLTEQQYVDQAVIVGKKSFREVKQTTEQLKFF